ncbi:hypothetical protein ACFL6Y_11070, partial [Elusimicrobiota bacterium]
SVGLPGLAGVYTLGAVKLRDMVESSIKPWAQVNIDEDKYEQFEHGLKIDKNLKKIASKDKKFKLKKVDPEKGLSGGSRKRDTKVHVSANADSNRIALIDLGKDEFKMWDLTGNQIKKYGKKTPLIGYSEGVYLDFTGAKLIRNPGTLSIDVIDLETGEEFAIKSTGYIEGAMTQTQAMSPDGARVVATSYGSKLRVWDIKAGKIYSLKGHSNYIVSAAFSHDGHKIISASGDGSVKVWDLRKNKKTVQTLAHDGQWQGKATFSPDGAFAAVISRDNTIHVWDLKNGQLRILQGHKADVTSISFSKDSTHLVSTSIDGTVRAWDITMGRSFKIRAHALNAFFYGEDHAIVFVTPKKELLSWNLAESKNIFNAAVSKLNKHLNSVPRAANKSMLGKKKVKFSLSNAIRTIKNILPVLFLAVGSILVFDLADASDSLVNLGSIWPVGLPGLAGALALGTFKKVGLQQSTGQYIEPAADGQFWLIEQSKESGSIKAKLRTDGKKSPLGPSAFGKAGIKSAMTSLSMMGTFKAVVNNEVVKDFDWAADISISPEMQHVTYKAGKDGKDFPVLDKEPIPGFKRATKTYFAQSGELVIEGEYKGEEGKWIISKITEAKARAFEKAKAQEHKNLGHIPKKAKSDRARRSNVKFSLGTANNSLDYLTLAPSDKEGAELREALSPSPNPLSGLRPARTGASIGLKPVSRQGRGKNVGKGKVKFSQLAEWVKKLVVPAIVFGVGLALSFSGNDTGFSNIALVGLPMLGFFKFSSKHSYLFSGKKAWKFNPRKLSNGKYNFFKGPITNHEGALAYIAKRDFGDFSEVKKWLVVFEGAGPWYDQIEDLVLDREGKPVYRARKGTRWWRVVHGIGDLGFTRTEETMYTEVKNLIVGPNGELAYKAKKGNKVLVVLNSEPGLEYDRIDYMYFLSDGRLVHHAKEGQEGFLIVDNKKVAHSTMIDDKNVVMFNGEYFPGYDGAGGLVISSKDELAYRVREGEKQRIVLNGEPGPKYEWVSFPVFSDDGRLAYIAHDGEQYFAVLDGKPGPSFDWASNPVFAPDGRLIYTAIQDEKESIVIDHEPGEEFDSVSDPQFAPNGDVIYKARKDDKWFVVLENKSKFEFEDIKSFGFGLDGQILVSGSLNGDDNIWAFEPVPEEDMSKISHNTVPKAAKPKKRRSKVKFSQLAEWVKKIGIPVIVLGAGIMLQDFETFGLLGTPSMMLGFALGLVTFADVPADKHKRKSVLAMLANALNEKGEMIAVVPEKVWQVAPFDPEDGDADSDPDKYFREESIHFALRDWHAFRSSDREASDDEIELNGNAYVSIGPKRAGPNFEDVDCIQVSPDDELVYAAKKKNVDGKFIVIDDVIGPKFDSITDIRFEKKWKIMVVAGKFKGRQGMWYVMRVRSEKIEDQVEMRAGVRLAFGLEALWHIAPSGLKVDDLGKNPDKYFTAHDDGYVIKKGERYSETKQFDPESRALYRAIEENMNASFVVEENKAYPRFHSITGIWHTHDHRMLIAGNLGDEEGVWSVDRITQEDISGILGEDKLNIVPRAAKPEKKRRSKVKFLLNPFGYLNGTAGK